jgi:hypothetical protein
MAMTAPLPPLAARFVHRWFPKPDKQSQKGAANQSPNQQPKGRNFGLNAAPLQCYCATAAYHSVLTGVA